MCILLLYFNMSYHQGASFQEWESKSSKTSGAASTPNRAEALATLRIII